MKNNIMKTINNMCKSTPTLEESELLKLDSLLTQVGGDAKSILLSAEGHTMADFIDTCIRNRITFELREAIVESSPPSETAPVSNDNTLPTQSPSEKEKSCEDCCTEASPRLTRITLDNWNELLNVGDRVVSMDGKGNDRLVHKITDLVAGEYDVACFMELDDGNCPFLEDDNTCDKGREYYAEKCR